MKTLTKRLARLETQFGARVEAVREPGLPSGAEKLAGWVAAWGTVREPNESLAETTARAMGISSQELRAKLLERAAGVSSRPGCVS
jgi:hypothetical protein